jgi:isoleucyl-tRNA synthetase
MSKHLGNILEPMPLMDAHGADAVRWFMSASGSPWSARRIGHRALEEIVRKVLLTYWNTASFQSLYARTAGWTPGDQPDAERSLLDRWALSELQATITEVDDALERFDPQRAGRRLAAFVDDLSNWYVRRSRRRFWDGEPAALQTLHECLDGVTRLMAPFTPFITERVWQALIVPTAGTAPDSVHLAEWPAADPSRTDDRLGAQMALVRRLVELGRAARADSGVKTRQPLARALVGAEGWPELPEELRALVAEELNVLGLDALAGGGDLLEVTVKPNFRALGKRFGARTKAVAAAVTAADPADLAAALRSEGAVVAVDGEQVRLGQDEVVVTETPRSGWAVASDAGETLALDLAVTPELRRAGLARDAVRLIQEGRKRSGLQVADRIELWWAAAQPDGELARALVEHAELVAREVLAVSYEQGRPNADIAPHCDEELGLTFWLRAAGE